jgi:hypothetical protein
VGRCTWDQLLTWRSFVRSEPSQDRSGSSWLQLPSYPTRTGLLMRTAVVQVLTSWVWCSHTQSGVFLLDDSSSSHTSPAMH